MQQWLKIGAEEPVFILVNDNLFFNRKINTESFTSIIEQNEYAHKYPLIYSNHLINSGAHNTARTALENLPTQTSAAEITRRLLLLQTYFFDPAITLEQTAVEFERWAGLHLSIISELSQNLVEDYEKVSIITNLSIALLAAASFRSHHHEELLFLTNEIKSSIKTDLLKNILDAAKDRLAALEKEMQKRASNS